MNKNALQRYHALHDRISEMIEDGRLKKSDVPQDYEFLVESLAALSGSESGRLPRVLIFCEGGLVQNVVSEVPLDVSLLDYDDPTEGDTLVNVPQSDGRVETAALSCPECEVAPDRVTRVVECFPDA